MVELASLESKARVFREKSILSYLLRSAKCQVKNSWQKLSYYFGPATTKQTFHTRCTKDIFLAKEIINLESSACTSSSEFLAQK